MSFDESWLLEPNPNSKLLLLYRKGRDLSLLELKSLEKHSEDLQIRVILLGYYATHHFARTKLANSYVPLLQFFIEKFPHSFITWASTYHHNDSNYTLLKNKWLLQVRQNPTDVIILHHAAHFCYMYSKSTAGKLWKKAQSLDQSADWSYHLARLYLSRITTGKNRSEKKLAKLATEEFLKAMSLAKRFPDQSNLTAQMSEQMLVELAETTLKCNLTELSSKLGYRILRTKEYLHRGLMEVSLRDIGRSIVGRSYLKTGDVKKASLQLAKIVTEHKRYKKKLITCPDLSLVNSILIIDTDKHVVAYIQYYASLCNEFLHEGRIDSAHLMVKNWQKSLQAWLIAFNRGRPPVTLRFK